MNLKPAQKRLLIVLATAVIVGGGSFYAGLAYGKKSAASAAGPSARGAAFFQGGGAGFDRASGNGGAAGQTGRNGSRMNGSVSGEILKIDDQSITVKLPDGGSRLVFTSDKTTVAKTGSGSMSDLAAGVNVRVIGTANSDGSVTAQSVQIVPAGQEQPAPPASPPTGQ